MSPETQHPSIEQVLGEKKGPKEGLETKESPDSLVEGEKAKGAEAVDNDSVGGPTKKEFDGMSVEAKWKTICKMTGLTGPVPPKVKAKYEAKAAAKKAARRAKMKEMVSKMGVLGVLNKSSKVVKGLMEDNPKDVDNAFEEASLSVAKRESFGPRGVDSSAGKAVSLPKGELGRRVAAATKGVSEQGKTAVAKGPVAKPADKPDDAA